MKTGSYVANILRLILIACLITSLAPFSSAQSAPSFQSVSGEFARKWIEEFRNENPDSIPSEANMTLSNQSDENQSDLWSWGSAPRGSKIVDGQLERDPNYLRPLLNLSSDWLGESYTDSETGLPMEVYSDPVTGRKYYKFLSPTTGLPFFSYYTYVEEETGRTIYVYVNPDTGKEVHATSAPVEIIRSLAAGMTDQTF